MKNGICLKAKFTRSRAFPDFCYLLRRVFYSLEWTVLGVPLCAHKLEVLYAHRKTTTLTESVRPRTGNLGERLTFFR